MSEEKIEEIILRENEVSLGIIKIWENEGLQQYTLMKGSDKVFMLHRWRYDGKYWKLQAVMHYPLELIPNLAKELNKLIKSKQDQENGKSE